jgi:murein DD-endopeptidase MepM/ murein hydrolase activator NlpD
VRRMLATVTVAAGLLFLLPTAARADCTTVTSPAACNPTPTTTTPPPTTPPGGGTGTTTGGGTGTATVPPTPAPTPDPVAQALIDKVRTDLGSGVADALATVQKLSDGLSENADEQGQIQQRVDDAQAQLDALDQQIQDLTDEITSTQQQIDDERTEIGILARELYQEPDSLLLRLLRAGSLREMVTQTSDLTVAAMHADALKAKLSSDLTKEHQDQTARQRDRDMAAQIREQLDAALGQLQGISQLEQGSSDQLQSAIADTQSAMDGLDTRGVAAAQQVGAMLLQRQEQLIATAEHEVWLQEQLWATLNNGAIPAPPSTTLGEPRASGTPFAWPIQGAVLTQGFGPSTLWLEPAMFGFPHFHTGLDLASANTRITAAADGVVAVVGTGTTGYGNYVIIVHGGGLVTLYGHLSLAMVQVGQTVMQGQQIGVEGTTGASTGVHLHFEVRLNGTPLDPSPFLPPMGTA